MYSGKEYFLSQISQAEFDTVTEKTDSKLDSAIAAADSIIDGYLRSRITELPLINPPESIKLASFRLSMYILYGRVSPNNIPDLRVKQNDDAVSFLKDVQAGRVKLMPEVAADVQEVFIEYGGFDTVMTRKG